MSHNVEILVLAVFLAGLPRTSSAYLDPGTGSYIFQVLIGVLLGGIFLIKTWWRRIAALAVRLFSREKHDDDKH